jgi:hypothetical protein
LTGAASSNVLKVGDTMTGALTMSGQPSYIVSGTSITTTGGFFGNGAGLTSVAAATATNLAANGANCAAGNSPLGVDAAGAVESCFDVATQTELNTHAALAGTSAHGAASANTASAIVARDASGNFSAGTITAALSGNATTATNLAANGANCAAGNAPLGVTAGGAVESCFDVATQAELDAHTGLTSTAHGATSAATATTLMARDGNADTSVRYLNSQYVNMSHSAAAAITDSVFYSSTDGYIRKNTATGFRDSLFATSGTASDTRTIRFRESGDTPIAFGSYGGSWRSGLQLQSNDSARLLFMVPPESDYGYSIIRSANGGMKMDVGGTTGDGGTNALSIETSGAVTAPVSMTATQFYTGNWFRNTAVDTGLYNEATGKHFYSESTAYWAMNSTNGMRLRSGHAGTTVGYLYWDGTAGSNNFGLLSPSGSWRVRVDNSNTQLYGGTYHEQLWPKYSTWAGNGDGGSGIINDNGSYQALMIVGSDQDNTTAGCDSVRCVRLWDRLRVEGNTMATGDTLFGTGTSYKVNSSGAATLAAASVGNITKNSADMHYGTTGGSGAADAHVWWSGAPGSGTRRAALHHNGNLRAVSHVTTSLPDIAEFAMAEADVETSDLVSVSEKELEIPGPGGERFQMRKSRGRYESKILGVVAEPGSGFQIQAHMNDIDKNHPGKPLVLAGRVPVKVTDENGPIKVGDYLTSSSKPGYAMKATEPGPTVGIALQSHESGEGKVLCFVHIGERNTSSRIEELEKRIKSLEQRLQPAWGGR